MVGDSPQFQGSFVALITPFDEKGKVDEQAFQAFVEYQIEAGTQGLVPCGTTGEGPTLSHEEHNRVIQLTVEAAAGRVPVIAGTGSNATSEAIDLSKSAEQAGADAILCTVPYYNKPSQEGLFQHYKAIHDATDLPMILYDVPGRSVVALALDTVKRLSELSRVAGIKDATADLTLPQRYRLEIDKPFSQLSGEDATVIPYLAHGGHGCISVTANVAPALCAEMHNAWQAGDIISARDINAKLMVLHDAMFCNTNPMPAKYAAAKLGLIPHGGLRLPLVSVDDIAAKEIDAALTQVGLL